MLKKPRPCCGQGYREAAETAQWCSDLSHQAGIFVDVGERLTRTFCHTEERFFSYVEGDVDLIAQTLCQTAKEGTTTCEINTVLYDVGIEFRWSVRERNSAKALPTLILIRSAIRS